jgi:molecular chaperone GrpE (heat shock protein)
MMVQSDPARSSGEIIAVVRTGYRINDRVLRHAQVIVAE